MFKFTSWGLVITSLFLFSIEAPGSPPKREKGTCKVPSCVIAVDADHTVRRTKVRNDSGSAMAWVIRRNGQIVLQRNARKENQFQYSRNTPGVYTIYLQQFVDGAYRVISNVVSYRVRKEQFAEEPPCHIYLSQDRLVNRSLIDDEHSADLSWVVLHEGKQVLKRNAKNETQFRYFGSKPGKYEISVQRNSNGEWHQESNVVRYVLK